MARWYHGVLAAGAALAVAGPVAHRSLQTPDASFAQKTVAAQGSTAASARSPHPGATDVEANRNRARLESGQKLQGSICGFLNKYGQEPGGAYCKGNQPSGVRVIVAILPDPAHTHLALRFDRSLESIQGSLQDLGWIFDSAWLPWETETPKSPDRYWDRVEDAAARESREELPGALLFRSQREDKDSPQEPLIVLVVGDKPTSGVNANQFNNAVNIWRTLDSTARPGTPSGKQAAAPEQHLMILGPTFTGSMSSLKSLLTTSLFPSQRRSPNGTPFPCPSSGKLRVTIAGGTVSDAGSLDAMSMGDIDDPLDNRARCPTLSVNPVSFDTDLRYGRIHLIKFLKAHNPNSSIMQLSEDESQYGNAVFEVNRSHSDQGGPASTFAEANTDKRKREEAVNDLLLQLLRKEQASWSAAPQIDTMFFPRGISRLRKAYEENGILGFSTPSTASRTELQLNLGADTRDDDSVPIFSGSQEASAMEAQMAEIADTLTTEHFDFVVLSATDVLDEIFVSHYLAEHAPNVTVILQDTDLLFLHTGQGNSSLTEAYVAGAWPVIEQNRRWSSDPDQPYRPLRLHQSGAEQGLYNAATYLVCDGDLLGRPVLPGAAGGGRTSEIQPPALTPACPMRTFRGLPKPGLALGEYEPPLTPDALTPGVKRNGLEPDTKLEPPLWLSVLGHHSFQPIALVDIDQEHEHLPDSGYTNLPRTVSVLWDSKDERNDVTIHPRGIHERTSTALKALALGIFALSLWHVVSWIRCRLDRSFAWRYALAETEHRIPRLTLQIAISLLAVPALALLRIPRLPHFSVVSDSFLRWITFLQVTAILTAIYPAFFLVKKGSVVGLSRQRIKWGAGLFAVACGFVGSLCLVFSPDLLWSALAPSHDRPTEYLLFLYRGALLFSGSSPFVPTFLILAAFGYWLLSRFGRLIFFGHRIPVLPDGNKLPLPKIRNLDFLSKVLSRPLHWTRLPGFCAILALELGFLWISHLRLPMHSLAHGRFDDWISIAVILLIALIVHDVVIATIAWNLLREYCLLPLKHLPLRWGFTWIKGFSWKRLWTAGDNLSPDSIFDYMNRLVESNNRIGAYGPATMAYDALREAYDDEEKPEPQWTNKVTSCIGHLYQTLADAAGEKISWLSDQWSLDRGPVSGSKELERGVHNGELPDKLADGQEKALALRRMADEEFVALVYLGYIRMVLIQIRNRLMTAVILYLLVMWAMTSYPWMYRHSILLVLSVLLAIITAAAIHIYGQMYRDEILSRTTETESGKLDADFYTKILSVVGLPLVTLIASQFPEVSAALFSWLNLSSSH